TGGTQPYTYTWSNGAGSQNVENVASGNYTLIITDASGCKDTANVLLPASAGPTVVVNSTPDSCNLNVGTITVSVTNGLQPYSYTWSNGATTANLNNVSTGNYSVEVKDANNCVVTTSVVVAENACPQNPTLPNTLPSVLEMPNVFTPNADGKNDSYLPAFQQNITVQSFVVLNRWGNVMYENDVEILWDGKSNGNDAVSGTYFYLVRYTTYLNEEKILHGFFHLLR
ncbi:MAG TPA: gliding motility-associated C-terminal domain-containing protein, partial [Crocinitomicaceae bacterium]|nr:gliding motility-associated C-terminal domain-containing protein [Crocinitomicaceae bacterium]